jgi:hypothetical protein
MSVFFDNVVALRNWMSRTNPWMLMVFTEIEDEVFALQRKLLVLEEENQRLKRLLRS